MPVIREEAAGAAAWWAAALRDGADPVDLERGALEERAAVFERALAERIEAICADAGWEPEVPTYGTCGRQLAGGRAPARALERAALAAGDRSLLDRLPDAVMWVNPGEVLVQLADATEPAQVWSAAPETT
jgi:BTG family protein